MQIKPRFSSLILLILSGITLYAQAGENTSKIIEIQQKAQQIISLAVMQCSIDNGSNYSTIPYQRKLINPQKTITIEDEMEMDGMSLKTLKGLLSFKDFSNGELSLRGALNYDMVFVDGDSSHFKGKYKGTLHWTIGGKTKFKVTAVYDYLLESKNNKIKIKGTVKVGDKTYDLSENGTLKL